jgi:hypothetical protein
MDALLADAESQGSVFDGPMVEDQATIIADEVVEPVNLLSLTKYLKSATRRLKSKELN